jgi:DNA-binding NtrC family response regulator
MRVGASDFPLEPFGIEQFLVAVMRSTERRKLSRENLPD